MSLGNLQPMVFRLAKRAGPGNSSDLAGSFLDASGAYLGETPLFAAERDAIGRRRWRVREQAVLERVLSAGYGFPISVAGRMGALRAAAAALSKGECARAAISLLHARIPPLPDGDAMRRMEEAERLEKYSPDQPRIPEGQHGGGQWTREGEGSPASQPRQARGTSTQGRGRYAVGVPGRDGVEDAQAISPPMVGPWEFLRPLPIPRPMPFPGDFPYPFITPRIVPPRYENPHPDDPECVEEWEYAKDFCQRLIENEQLGEDPYRGMGRTYAQCVMGQVSARCGGGGSVA